MAHSEARKISNGQMSSILCGDPLFWRFLKEWVWAHTEVELFISNKEQCKKSVYWLFEVESRSELNEGAAATSWRRVHKDFKRWKDVF
ncbi:coil containing protein [Vibrio phage 1.111.B._10N.286.45.E6]|nr:coil containing protein [Vibrio phage 1.111.A._10N.286.45.E6]AUR88261.1 coil containing protein [Vibrio phage 1.111.B._10N.286.45.E6]